MRSPSQFTFREANFFRGNITKKVNIFLLFLLYNNFIDVLLGEEHVLFLGATLDNSIVLDNWGFFLSALVTKFRRNLSHEVFLDLSLSLVAELVFNNITNEIFKEIIHDTVLELFIDVIEGLLFILHC